MEPPQCEWRIPKISLAEILRCFEHPISEEQAWAICFQCCCKMKQLAQGLHPSLHAVVIKGPGSIFIHTDGTASFKVYQKSDVGNTQQLEDKLLEYLGVVIYEALDWGIDSQVERELSEPLEKLLSLMLKLDDEAMKLAVTLQDVIKVCEERLSRPSEAASHYKVTCRSLFTEYMELQKLLSIIQTSKESLRKMDMESLLENPFQKKEKYLATLWPDVIRELQNGVRLRKATERPQHRAPPKEYTRSPYELLVDDIQHKRYTLRKVIIEQKCKSSKADATASMPHLKPVLERKLKECMPQEPIWHEQLMAEIKQPQKLWPSTARENGSRPKEMPVSPNIALKSPRNSILTLQNVSTEFKIVNTITQQLGPGVQETTPKLPSSTQLASTRSSVMTCNSTGLSADCTCAPIRGPMLGDIKPISFLSSSQQELPPYRGRSRSLESALQSTELDCPFPTKWPSPTIAELIGTRYAMMVLEGEGSPQRGGDGVFPRAKICFSCHKQMFLKWPYSCYLCSSVVCCDCCIKMSMPFRMCVHLPLSFLKLLRLSKEEDPSTQEQKSSELLHELEHWECSSVPVMLEPHCLAQPLCCYPGTMADWLSVDICTQCEQYLLNMASGQQQSISLGRIFRSWTKLE
ncbi:protein spire homolog 1-like [Apteryx rowi]|uniref:protein spire homolog 1-like n=1 Tax=Apteryx rowi TaxID=308060 RepID=UPI0006B0F257|nr:PREDICTED: protein spire homolog 1-like [Apteryx mantelli mantelli]XP_025938357.1 protein spire homolog 1-like [Apteryx rowi]